MPKIADMPPAHREQCAAFLRELRRTGNVEASAHAIGVSRATMVGRRKRFPVFATNWDAARAFAQAALHRKGGRVAPKGNSAKTQGGEYTVSGSGKRPIQVRRAAPGRLSAEGETAFLAALAATANIRLACDTVGVSHVAIYKRRESDKFADEMDAALEHGYQRLETEMLESAIASLDPRQLVDWMDETTVLPSPLLRMSFDQICQLLGRHHKRAVMKHDRHAHNRKQARAEETDAEITKLLDQLKRREAEALARGERMAAREGKG